MDEEAYNEGRKEADSPTTKTAGRRVSWAEDAVVEEKAQEETTFPLLLMNIIEEETMEGTASVKGEKVIEWLPSGDAFVVRDRATFEREILPSYTGYTCKFASFVRKLYRYGFHQVEKHTPDIMVFMHPNFVRGDKRRCRLMRLVPKKRPFQGARPGLAAGFAAGEEHLQTASGPSSHRGRGSISARNTFTTTYQYSPQQAHQVQHTKEVARRDSTEAGLRLAILLKMCNKYGSTRAAPSFSPMPSSNQNQAMVMNNSYELELAARMMKRDPGLEPWKALELVKGFVKELGMKS